GCTAGAFQPAVADARRRGPAGPQGTPHPLLVYRPAAPMLTARFIRVIATEPTRSMAASSVQPLVGRRHWSDGPGIHPTVAAHASAPAIRMSHTGSLIA